MKSRSKILVFSALVIFLLQNCYERKEGCLDLLADNYDVLADDQCLDCCTFPKFSIEIEAVNGVDTIYTLSDTIYTNSGDSIQILESRFYISGISIYEKGKTYNSKLTIIDSITKNSYIDDVVFLRPQDKTISAGQYVFSGKPDSIICHLGLNDDMLASVFNAVSTSHPLNSRNLLSKLNGEKAMAYIKYSSFDKGIRDTNDVFITKPIFKKLKWDEVLANRPGSNVKVKMKADYSALMAKIQKNMTEDSAENAISENLNSFLSVK